MQQKSIDCVVEKYTRTSETSPLSGLKIGTQNLSIRKKPKI